jgi:DNA-binding GntR family transcriptional regulator
MEFHLLPISWTNNQKLYKIYQAQNFQWNISRLLQSFAGQAEHWNIFKAYEKGSLEEVKEAITSHLTEGKVSVEQKIH